MEEVFGPRGGWKSVTFGDTKFICKEMKKDYFGKISE